MSGRWFVGGCLAMAWSMGCATDRFSVVDGSLSGDGDGDSPGGAEGEGGSHQSSGGKQSASNSGGSGGRTSSGGATNKPGSGGDESSDGSGGEASFEWSGDREGPLLAELDTTLGGLNADLPKPEACEDFPEHGCAHVSGLVGGDAVSLTCSASSFVFEEGILSCEGDGFSLTFPFAGVIGAPPSSFNYTADPSAHPFGASFDSPYFASHIAGDYVIEEDYEQLGQRAVGTRYNLIQEDMSKESFVSFAFGLRFLPRPTCATCPEVRLRGVVSAYTGTLP